MRSQHGNVDRDTDEAVVINGSRPTLNPTSVVEWTDRHTAFRDQTVTGGRP
ncbi:hypothetical protein [Halostella sp. PRR32]|uniref:hypothetical protein n=1 Tax=Halostella sp. PRR32 TaxID=3098147 RepID=UPI002B1E7E88|nr:hypothetical protein [Halostella sp. PRR32]